MNSVPYALPSVKRSHRCYACGVDAAPQPFQTCDDCTAEFDRRAARDDLQDARTEAALRFDGLPEDENAPGWAS